MREYIDEMEKLPRLIDKAMQLENLAYTHQAAALELVLKYLNSDEIIPGEPPDVPDVGVSFYAATALENEVEGIPKKNSSGGVAEMRKWVAAQKKLPLK